MAAKPCGPKSKFMKEPDRYDCVNGRSVLKPELRQPRGVRTKCTDNKKFTADPRYECGEKTGFRWKLKKGFKAIRAVGAPKRPQTAFFLWMADNRKRIEVETGLKGKGLVSYLGASWNELSDVDKAPYVERANQLKSEYQLAKDLYEGPQKTVVQKEKRPETEWVKFSKATRPIVKKQHPEMSFGDISKKVGELWQQHKLQQ